MACFFCGTEGVDGKGVDALNHLYEYRCPICGYYQIPDINRKNDFPDKHLIAGYLCEKNREANNKGSFTTLTQETIELILSSATIPKTVMQKLEKLLRYFYKKNEYIGQEHEFGTSTSPSIAYAKNYDELSSMVNVMDDMGWLKNFVPSYAEDSLECATFSVSINGLKYAEQLLTTNIDSKKVFVAMGFKCDLLDACKNAIKPACDDCGFDAFLISDKEHNQGITDEIIVAIKTSKFVITDFTYNNCGAYFEAGYAQGLGLEVIRCCKKDWFEKKDESGKNKNSLHFDIRHYNLILWENHEDFKKKLKSRIRATIPGAKMNDNDDN